MKRNKKYILRNVADVYFLYTSDENEHGENKTVFMNETSAFIWSKIEGSCTIDSLVEAISKEYQVDECVARDDVMEYTAFLAENGCIDLEG